MLRLASGSTRDAASTASDVLMGVPIAAPQPGRGQRERDLADRDYQPEILRFYRTREQQDGEQYQA